MSNTGAQELYREFGFAPAGIRKNYYAEVHEDALVMWAHDVHTAEYGARLDAIAARLDRPSGPAGPPEPEGPAGARTEAGRPPPPRPDGPRRRRRGERASRP